MMKWLKRAPKKYSDNFLIITKGLPQLPAKTQKRLSGYLPWLLACFSFGAFWTAWQLWQEGRPQEVVSNIGGALGKALSGTATVETGTLYWVELVVLCLIGVCFVFSFLLMQNRRSAGWRLGLICSTLMMIVYALVVSNTGTESGPEVPAVLSASLILAYLFNQVRSYFPEKSKPWRLKLRK